MLSSEFILERLIILLKSEFGFLELFLQLVILVLRFLVFLSYCCDLFPNLLHTFLDFITYVSPFISQ